VSAVTKYFFSPVYAPQSAWEVVSWWEARRPMYNLVVGGAGVLSLAVATIMALLPPNPVAVGVPWPAIVIYGVLANLCYSLGPAIDLFIRRRWGNSYAPVGPAMFRYGFAFSVGLSLLPIPITILGWGLRILGPFR
jgi:hypothetical protein